jgi:hypothetical protein
MECAMVGGGVEFAECYHREAREIRDELDGVCLYSLATDMTTITDIPYQRMDQTPMNEVHSNDHEEKFECRTELPDETIATEITLRCCKPEAHSHFDSVAGAVSISSDCYFLAFEMESY